MNPAWSKYPRPASCPMCDKEPLWVCDVRPMLGRFAVVCDCGLNGPIAERKEWAAWRWNEQAVEMKRQEAIKARNACLHEQQRIHDDAIVCAICGEILIP